MIDDGYGFSELAEKLREGELRAQAIAVGIDVSGEDKVLFFGDDFFYFFKNGNLW